MGGISQLQITQLKIFVQIYESNPSILHMPELGFLKEWLERMGANIPPPPHKTPKLEPWMETVEPMEPESTLEPESDESDIEFKPDIGCLTDGCDSENYLSGKFDRHGTAGSYPLSLKHKQDDFQEDCESAPKKQKFDTEASSGTGREIDDVLLKEVSDFPLKVTVKQEPLSDDDYPTDNLAQFQSAIKNRSVSESSVRVKQEVDESENSKPQVSSNDADTLQKIGEGNGERITQSSSDKSIKDDLMNIDSNNTDNTNILTRTLASKSVETASSELPRKVAENQEQNENGGLSMDRLSPVTIVVKQELDDDSDDSRADEDKVNLVVAEWTDRQLQEAGTSCAQKEDEEERTRPSCVSSEDSDLCKKDNQKDGQDTDLNNGPPSGDKQDTLENRQQAIQRVIQSLVHACQCRNTSCQFLSCIKLKRTVAHTKNCHKMTNSSCDICKQFIALCCYHAKHCNDKKCKVPFCLQIKTKICLQRIEQRLKHTQMMIQQTLTMQRTKSSAPAPPPADSVGTQPIPSGKPAGAPQAAAMQVDLEAQKTDQRGSVSNIDNSMANPTPSIGMAEMDNIPSVVEDLRIRKPKVGSRKIRLIPGKMQVPQPPTTQLLNGLTGVGLDKQIIHENAMEVNTQQQSLSEVHSSETSSAQGPTASTVTVVTSTSSTTSSMSTLAGNSFDIKTEIETEDKTKNGLTGVGLDKQIKHESAMEVNTQPQSLSEVHSSEKTSAQGPTASTVSVVTSTSSTTSSMSTFAGNSINIKTEIETEDKTDNGLTGVGIGKQIIHENAMDVNTQHQSLSEVHSSETSSAQGPTASTVSFVTSTSSTTSSMSTFAGNSIDIKPEIETEDKTEEEKESGCLQVPVHQVSQRVANYSGLPVSTCKTLTQASSSSHPKPKKSRQNALESLDRDLVRRTVYKILANGKTIPTAKSIQKALRNSMDFPSGLTYLRKLLKELGFTWRKCGSNRRLLTERPDIVIARINFLLKIKEYRDSGRHIVYTLVHSTHRAQKCWQSDNATLAVPFTHGEHLIVLHAGSSEGFLKGAGLVFKANCSTVDNLLEMIGQNFTKWLNEKLIPNLPKNAVLVVENAPYHNIQREKCPTHYTSKADIQAWLERHNIPFAENMLKPKLLELCKGHKPASKYDLDSTLEQFGHTCLRLPQYHTELNVIEMVWGIIKHQIAASNLTFKLKDTMTLIHEAIDSVTPSEWDSCFRHVREAEERFRKTDIAIEEAFKGFIIEVNKEEGTDITSEDTELTDMELSAKDGMEAESDDTERTDTASENGETQVN